MLHYDQTLKNTRKPDLEKERSEKLLSLKEFLTAYNTDLPASFPKASHQLLTEFKAAYPGLFKNNESWTLAQHRKRVMDWLPQQIESPSK